MRKLLCVVVLVWAGGELSGQTIVQQFTAVSSGAGTISDMDVKPTTGSVLIAMPELLSPDVKVVEVTDNAPAGGNTYKKVNGASSTCPSGPLEIWYCENCNPGVTELRFHNSGHVRASLNSFLEVSDLAAAPVLDGNGAQISNGTATSGGLEVGPSITTTVKDFVVAGYSSTAPRPTGVTPAPWTYKTAYVYALNAPPGVYQPTLTGAEAKGSFCMVEAAFKIKSAAAGH